MSRALLRRPNGPHRTDGKCPRCQLRPRPRTHAYCGACQATYRLMRKVPVPGLDVPEGWPRLVDTAGTTEVVMGVIVGLLAGFSLAAGVLS